MTEFKVGDLVQLKSGGPIMTVGGNSANGEYISLLWFYDGSLQREAIQTDLLVRYYTLDGAKASSENQNLDGAKAPSENQFKRMVDASTPEPCPVCLVTNPHKKMKCTNLSCPYPVNVP